MHKKPHFLVVFWFLWGLFCACFFFFSENYVAFYNICHKWKLSKNVSSKTKASTYEHTSSDERDHCSL